MKRMRWQKIGLTGGIGAGKSTVSARLRSLGAFVQDADGISRRLLDVDGACYDLVAALFPEALLGDGRLDRGRIAASVFSDPGKRLALNDIVHPAVIARMHADADAYLVRHPKGMVIFDVPLLIECGMHRDMDRVILVIAEDEARMRRILLRDGCTREQAEARFAAQMPQREKLPFADDIIDNSGDMAQLYEQVDRLYAMLLGGDAAHAD